MSQSGFAKVITGGGGGGGITTINGDVSGVTGTTVIIQSDVATLNSGSSVEFVGDGVSTMTLNVTDSDNNTMIGNGAGSASLSGEDNTALGYRALGNAGSVDSSTAIGTNALLASVNDSQNTAVGFASLSSLNGGSGNTGLGKSTLIGLNNGVGNLALGIESGINYTTNESYNILISNDGTPTESNVLRIGAATGTAPYELSQVYICGIDGVDLATVNIVTEDSNQLGTAVLTAGSGITITPGASVITISGTTTVSSTNQIFYGANGVFTYTPSAGTVYAFVQVLGAGGGGGGTDSSGPADVIVGGGGGGGGYTEAFISASSIGVSQTVTVGAGGAGVFSDTGGDGAASSFGTLVVANGGLGGTLGEADTSFLSGGGGGGYTGTAIQYGYAGQNGGNSGPGSDTGVAFVPQFTYAGYGGSCFTGRQAEGFAWSTVTGAIANPGDDQTEYGCGGPGGFSAISSAATAGGSGMDGFVIITEYIQT